MTPLALAVLFGLVSTPEVIDLHLGVGPVIQRGDRYTLSYKVEIVGGKELANSDRRGLPFSKELGDGHDGYFDQWVEGMSVGGKRQIRLGADQVPEVLKFTLPSKMDVVVTVWLVALKQNHPE